MKEINLRAHHLLCIQGFQGYGYNKEFTNHLMNFINSIKLEDKLKIKLLSKCDDICEKCPNNRLGVCIHGDVVYMDKQILDELNITKALEISFKDLVKIVNSKFGNHKKCNDICGNCSWKDVCLWFEKAYETYI